MLSKLKEKVKIYESDIITALVIVLVALIAFGLGRLSVLLEKKEPIRVETAPAAAVFTEVGLPTGSPTSSAAAEKLYVASKQGTKYHFPWCPGAQSIKEENKIWFFSKEEAEKAGYNPAANCKGL